MRLLYGLYRKERRVNFAVHMLRYFETLLDKLSKKENGRPADWQC